MEKKNRKYYCCGAEEGSEIDGQEFEAETIEELLEYLQKYKQIHINYYDDSPDLDLWINLQ